MRACFDLSGGSFSPAVFVKPQAGNSKTIVSGNSAPNHPSFPGFFSVDFIEWNGKASMKCCWPFPRCFASSLLLWAVLGKCSFSVRMGFLRVEGAGTGIEAVAVVLT